MRFLNKLVELLIAASSSIGYFFMTANAPHGTTSEYSASGAESISRIVIVKGSIGNHVIVVIILGEPFYEFVAPLKPCRIASKLISVIIVLVCWE